MVPRARHLAQVERLLPLSPVVAILGARQVGKTTLARQVAERFDGPSTRFDLEDPDDLARLAEAKLALAPLRGLVVIDEVQRRPELFPILRVLVDRPDPDARFLVLGSASPSLLRQGSESLAGRILFHHLDGFATDEVGAGALDVLWCRGGFPRAFLADTDGDSLAWRQAFIRTFLERDVPQLGFGVPAMTLERFWRMLAHYHAQTWNGAELARGLGVSGGAVRRYLDVLTGAFVVTQLLPWQENIARRQVRSPKVYVADSGLLHALLGIRSAHDLHGHPKVGASWEGFAIREVAIRLGAQASECFFWAAHTGGDLDLLIIRGARRLGFEIKRTSSPRVTRSMHAALDVLGLDRLDVIHAGEHSFPMGERIRAVPLARLAEEIVLTYLAARFTGEDRHRRRLAKITALEEG